MLSFSSRLGVSFIGAYAVIGAIGCSDGANGAGGAPDAAVDAAASPVDAQASADAGDAGVEDLDATSTPDPSCAVYCASIAANCTGAQAQFMSDGECAKLCANMPVGEYGDSDDTLGCRQAHAEAAAKTPATSCAAAGPFGGGECGDACDDYCSLMITFCGGDDAPYTNKTVCWNDCMNHFPYDSNAAEYTDHGNTLNCRDNFLAHAAVPDAGDVATSCSAAGPHSTPCQ